MAARRKSASAEHSCLEVLKAIQALCPEIESKRFGAIQLHVGFALVLMFGKRPQGVDDPDDALL